MAENGRNGRQRVLPRVMGIVAVVLIIATFVLAIKLLDLTSSGFATLGGQQALQERQDCARTVSTERNAVIDRRDNAASAAILAVLDGIVNGGVAPTGVAEARAELDQALAAVQSLLPLDKAVDQRCPSI